MKTVKRAMALVCMTVCFMAGLAFSGCSHGGSDDESSGGGKNPFAGTEWTGGSSASLKFYSDYTVYNSMASVGKLRYKVTSNEDSYTATLYMDIAGTAQTVATFTILSADASSGEYKTPNLTTSSRFKKVGGSSDSSGSGSGSSSGEGNGGASSGNGSSGTSSGSTASSDPFKGTEWENGSDWSLQFGTSKTVRFYNGMTSGSYSYKVTSNGDSYTAYLYEAGYENDSHSYSFAIYDKYSTNGRFCDSGNVQLDTFSMLDSFFRYTKWEGYKCSLTFNNNYECDWTDDGESYKGNYSFRLSDNYIEASVSNLRIDDIYYYDKEFTFRISGENAQSGNLSIDGYSLTLKKGKYQNM